MTSGEGPSSMPRRRHALIASLLVLLCAAPGAPFARAALQRDAVIATLRELATPGEHHRHLARLVGTWQATGTYWLPSGEQETAAGTIENTWILGGLFLESRLTGELLGDTYEGRALEGYDYVTEQYMSSYVDTLGSFILNFTGTCEDDGRRRIMTAAFIDPVWGRRMISRSVLTVIDADTYRYESFLQHEDGREFPQMEFVARRVR